MFEFEVKNTQGHSNPANRDKEIKKTLNIFTHTKFNAHNAKYQLQIKS